MSASARSRLDKGDIADAIAHYQQALDLDANSVLAHMNLGIVLAQKEGDFR